MKSNRVRLPLALSLAFFVVSIVPAFGANRDIIELQTEITQLQTQMTQMKQSFDERMGVMKNLLEQNTDVTNKVTIAITALQASINKQQEDRSGQGDQLSGQIQSLNDTMDELKVRLTKLSKQLEDMQSAQQSMAAQQTQAQQQAQQQAQAMAQAPAPDVLYNNALRDYNGGKNDLAIQEFSDYIKFYPDTDLAGNCYFYIAEMQYKTGDFQRAVANYDLVLQNFPGGNKAAAAELKKGFALIELGKEEEGTQELKRVIQRYPRTNEATQAKERLRKTGAAPKSR
jgi:tol-pal system protein YbgF